ncbi:MAG: acyltransferase [Bacteroidota bacterium]
MIQQENTQRVHFKNIDTLRFIAAYMIVLLHCYFGWKKYFGQPTILTSNSSVQSVNKIEAILNNFGFGVDIFFIISGFLITYLLLSENDKNGKVDVIKFYIRRAFRIWPLYFFMLLIAPLLSYFFLEQEPGYFWHFIFAGNFDIITQGTKSVATDHLWSICIEEHFYLICPLLIAFVPIKKLPAFLLSVILISIIFRGYASSYVSNYGTVLYHHTLSRVDVLALGSLFGYLFYYQKIQFTHSLSIRLIIYTIFIFTFLNVDYNECGTFFAATIKKYFFVLCAIYWVGNFLFNTNNSMSSNDNKALNLFGKVSYGIYMFNPVIIFLFLELFEKYSLRSFPIFLGLVHITLAVTTILSYRFFELPFLALKENFSVLKDERNIHVTNETPLENNESEAVFETIPIKTKEDNQSGTHKII